MGRCCGAAADDRIRDPRRSIKNTALIVVLKGGKEHLEAGADKVVRKSPRSL